MGDPLAGIVDSMDQTTFKDAQQYRDVDVVEEDDTYALPRDGSVEAMESSCGIRYRP